MLALSESWIDEEIWQEIFTLLSGAPLKSISLATYKRSRKLQLAGVLHIAMDRRNAGAYMDPHDWLDFFQSAVALEHLWIRVGFMPPAGTGARIHSASRSFGVVDNS